MLIKFRIGTKKISERKLTGEWLGGIYKKRVFALKQKVEGKGIAWKEKGKGKGFPRNCIHNLLLFLARKTLYKRRKKNAFSCEGKTTFYEYKKSKRFSFQAKPSQQKHNLLLNSLQLCAQYTHTKRQWYIRFLIPTDIAFLTGDAYCYVQPF